ncbi:MAG: RNA pseudouridine synthase [Chlamydiia bacterium]|nr:RNA pseudouridine synthase [Chlamydiia bacterium]
MKPAGLLTQPDDTGAPSFQEELKTWIKEREHKAGNVFLHPIHRLDRQTSGLVLFARSSKALSRLNEKMREGSIERVYLAEIEGYLDQEEGQLTHYLVHGEHRAIVAHEGDLDAKKAKLTYKIVKRNADSTLVRVFLETGRYHQIRAQFSAIGHPVVGDLRYGASDKRGVIHLHCCRIAFQHPVTKELVEIEHKMSYL